MKGGWATLSPTTVLKYKKRKILTTAAVSLSAILLLPIASFAAEDASIDNTINTPVASTPSKAEKYEYDNFDVDDAIKLISHKQMEKISFEQESKRINLAKQEANKKKAEALKKQKEEESNNVEEETQPEETDSEDISDGADTKDVKESSSSDFTPPQSSALYEIDNPDPDYHGTIINLTEEDRNVLRGVIMGEAGGEGFVGACILAQTMRDNWLYAGYSSASEVQYGCQYDGWSDSTNDDVENAINFIFDQGGVAVQHRIRYMYCTSMCYSDWHETQNYILTYGAVRFFDSWN